MASLRFEWDPRKAAANLAKHGVSFGEAETAFTTTMPQFSRIRITPPRKSGSCC